MLAMHRFCPVIRCVSLQGSGNVPGTIATCVANLLLHFATFAPIRFARNTKMGQPSALPRTGSPTAVSMTWGQSPLEVPRLRSPFRSPSSPRGRGRGGGVGGESQKANSARGDSARSQGSTGRPGAQVRVRPAGPARGRVPVAQASWGRPPRRRAILSSARCVRTGHV